MLCLTVIKRFSCRLNDCMERPERREDAISLSRQTATVIATVAAAAITGVAWAIYSQSTLLAVHSEQLRALVEFQNRGNRFTAADGASHAQRLISLETHHLEHEKNAREGYGRIRALETWSARCTESQKNIISRIGTIERWAHNHGNGLTEYNNGGR